MRLHTPSNRLSLFVVISWLATCPFASLGWCELRSHNRPSSEQVAPIPADAPVITFDDMYHDFGKIRPDQTVTHDFKVSNTGKSTLHLKEVKAICGCTTAVMGKKELEPGESTLIEAIFTPEAGFTGAVRKTIVVESDDPSHSKLTLRFGAEVLPASAAAVKSAP